MTLNYAEILTGGAVGRPDAPTALGFLELAKAGREVWNQWRTDFPTKKNQETGGWSNHVFWRDDPNAQLVSLRDHGVSDFAGFHFGDGADFYGQLFPIGMLAIFKGATFGHDTNFRNAQFGGGVTFEGAVFGNDAFLNNLNFDSNSPPSAPQEQWIVFDGARFGDRARLQDWQLSWRHGIESMPTISFQKECAFGASLFFSTAYNCVTARCISFSGTSFGAEAVFNGGNQDGLTQDFAFESCVVGPRASFQGLVLKKAKFDRSQFGDGVNFSGIGYRNTFGEISFSNVKFEGVADFSNRQFGARTLFSKAKFSQVPLFHNSELHQDTAFDESSFPARAKGDGQSSRAYRTLKLAMSKSQATNTEQFFFRKEMAEEQKELWREGDHLRWLLYAAYGNLSEFGGSVLRPTIWFFATLLLSAGLYAQSSGVKPFWVSGLPLDIDQTLGWMTFSAVNSLPLGGLDDAARELRNTLHLTGALRNPFFTVLVVLHKLSSILFLFLIGLALRNHFKMK